jgi:hypothetical protein
MPYRRWIRIANLNSYDHSILENSSTKTPVAPVCSSSKTNSSQPQDRPYLTNTRFTCQHVSNICPTLQLVCIPMLQLLLQDLICQRPELLHHNFIVIFNGVKDLMFKPTTCKFCDRKPATFNQIWIELVHSREPRNRLSTSLTTQYCKILYV